MKQLLAVALFIIVLSADPGYAAAAVESPQPAEPIVQVVRHSIDRIAKKFKRTIRRAIGSEDDYPNPPWPRP